MSRTENSTKNIYTGFLNQILVIIFRFVTRTVFIKCLGEQYLGINGLFSNILTLLSLADLGIGTALVFSLYKPIVNKDTERQLAIIKFLRKVYIIIGLVIIGIGILLLPILQFVIKEKVDFVNLYIVFLIYVFQTASSYLFFSANTEFLGAHQKNYVANRISNIITIFSNIAQIAVLILTKNFYIYLITIVVFNILQAWLISNKAKKMYPFIKKKPRQTLTREEKKETFKDCGALLAYRVNYVVLTATDNVIISKYLGLVIVGLYSNYILITNSIVNVLGSFFNSITASIGNLHANDESEKDYFIFKLTNLLTVSCFGIFSIGIYNLINDFIFIWVGEKFLLSLQFVLILAVNLYVEGLRKFLSTYRTAYGLFRQAKFMPIFGMIVNIVVSIILVQKIGIFGVLLGTFISNMVSFMWYDPYIIYKKVFKKSPVEYYVKNILYLAFFALIGYGCSLLCGILNIPGILGFLIHGIICVTIPAILIVLIYHKTEYGAYIKEIITRMFRKIIKKERSNEK